MMRLPQAAMFQEHEEHGEDIKKNGPGIRFTQCAASNVLILAVPVVARTGVFQDI
jgi:hypothetical protein